MSYEAMRAWVEAHKDALPTTLAELSRFPIPFRKVIVNTVTPELRTALWREHLLTFLEPPTDLTPEQQELIRDAIAELPGIFGNSLEAGQARARVLEDRMRVLLTRQQAGQMFGTLGPPEPPEGLPLPPDAVRSGTA